MHKLNDLTIWQRSIDLSVNIYKLTSTFPDEERFGLISQMRRAAISIASNIAEGAGRNSHKEFIQFLSISNGSAYELQTQLIISTQLGFVDEFTANSILPMIDEIQKMNYGLQASIEKRIKK